MSFNTLKPVDGSYRIGSTSEDVIGVDVQDSAERIREGGAKNGSTVTVKETFVGPFRQTVLTLVNTPVAIVSVTTGAGVGGTKVYDFPAGHINVLGTVGDLSIAVASAEQANFTDNAPEGDIGIGSAAPANADALGTDATDDDFATATAFTMAAFEDASVTLPPDAASYKLDGTGTAKDVFVNVLVDAADIDDGVTTEVLVSGTIRICWLALGDY